ncbi:hypothetical protein POJ06DRAFT_250808 [Lipomyces tetrasporus]|uniref:Uncharacterized protein n=1 Tax=Lipomyces tetrasporus TaxID=54092 RepID=A0AAD7QTH8_9ASCO|nr:uncharacterized protein POJ06DRAFT_250808 [Lipomyces tetrasporus]KAJ8101217.1 hypothetical protein POJ06DRAFT_250808 [Lipomyces tetrasporus]
MSAGKRYPFPKHVWATTGGWWPNPKNWQRNTIGVTASLVGGGIFLLFFGPQMMEPKLSLESRDLLSLKFNEAARQGRLSKE